MQNGAISPRVLGWTALGVALVCTWAYLAGGILLMAFNLPYGDATPLTWFLYWFHHGEATHVMKWVRISAGISAAICLAPGLLFIPLKKRSLYGDARFATRAEIAKAGLFGDTGLIVGKVGRRFLMFDGMQHAIVSAPTRSGKGVGIVIPNLLHWPESVVVLDIKQENWNITSGYRSMHGQACYLFNPAASDHRTHRWNPLGYLSPDPDFRIDDVQKIANMLFPDKQGTDIIWTATPRSLFLGIVLYLAETFEKPLTIGQVLRETLEDGDGARYFQDLITNRAASDRPLSQACIRSLLTYASISSDNTRAGVMTGFRSSLELWMNPLIDAATSANDFDLREIRKRRMSVYIGVTPDNLERLAPILNLFFQQLLDLNLRELPGQNKAIRYTCLLLMDEFTAIGRIAVLSKGIGFIAGYKIRMMPIIQSPSQLVEVYGKEAARTFAVNHALNVVFPPKASDTETARDMSEWLGYQTVKATSVSKGKGPFNRKPASTSTSDQKRALMLPQEISGLGNEHQLVAMENCHPIMCRKVRYYEEPEFVSRLQQVSTTLGAFGHAGFSSDQLDSAVGIGELAARVPLISVQRDDSLGLAAGENVHAHGTVRAAEKLPMLPPLRVSIAFGKQTAGRVELGSLDRVNELANQLCSEAGIASRAATAD